MVYNLSFTWTVALVLAALWELYWKGLALWKAAQSKHQKWFIALLVLNTVGILPIIYLVLNHIDAEPAEKERGYHEKTVPIKG